MITRRTSLLGGLALVSLPAIVSAKSRPVSIDTPTEAPQWAILQRRLIEANCTSCEEAFAKYIGPGDELECVERWGANDGPDDAAEFTNDWFLLHALGGSDRVLELAQRFWEGHLRQYARARTTDVPIARQGMYHCDFPAQMDWQHNAEGLTSFNVMGLSTPSDHNLAVRTRRFADLYTGRDASIGNYDPQRRMIRSILNGSRGPMLRQATPLDWAGDPFDPTPFHLEHGEETYAQFLAHYVEYTDVVGDNPLNLQSTTLGLNAYALGLGERFRNWAVGYLDAWVDRAEANGGILPSKIGPDGRAAGDWWGGVYGWNFAPVVPQTGEREQRNRVPRSITAFMGAVLMTGSLDYIKIWRRQNALINDRAKVVGGNLSTPTMYGPEGWWGWKPGPYRTNGFEIWYVTQDSGDRELAGEHPWLSFLEGENPNYPEQALTEDLQALATRDAARTADPTTGHTRLADWTLDYTPALVNSLVQTMMGGLHIARPPWSPTSPPQGGVPLHCRLRYFDPANRRAGVPADVAALVTGMSDSETRVKLVNCGKQPRAVVVRGGAYGEHRIDRISFGDTTQTVGDRDFTVTLEAGCGTEIRISMARYANRPSLVFPWDR